MMGKLLVITHVDHSITKGKLSAYAPYVNEMNIWFRQVKSVDVVAPLTGKRSFTVEVPYDRSSVKIKKIPSFNLLSFWNVLTVIFKIPVIMIHVFKEMNRTDHIHLRCPGNIGLIACICQIFFPEKPKTAKYAGNWDPNAKQPWTYKLQKGILSNTFLTRNIKVLVYGDWPKQSKNIKPFFTASFSEKDIPQVSEKSFQEPLLFLFVGNLVAGKRPLEAIRLIEKLNSSIGNDTNREIPFKLEIYGAGPERDDLEEYCRIKKLQDHVNFKGVQPLEELKEAYQKAHFLILPSRSEGWPKAIAEAMFFGCIPIATPVSCVPWMLGNGSRGILLEDSANGQPPTANSQIEKIRNLLSAPRELQRMSNAGREWSQQYTLERFEGAIQDILNKDKG